MEHIKDWENFNESVKPKSLYGQLLTFLSEKDFELYDGGSDLKRKFTDISTDDDLTPNRKSSIITSYLDEKWGLYDGYEEVLDFLTDLFKQK